MYAKLRAPAACALVCALLFAPAALTAQDGRGRNEPAPSAAQSEIVVQAPTLAQWSAGLSRELDRRIPDPGADFRRPTPEGVALVRFTCSDTGAPDKVVLHRSSGARRLDRSALEAVQRIKTMHPLPAGVGHDQHYQAVIVFARNGERRDRLLAGALKDPELRRLAAAGGGSAIALVAPAPVAPAPVAPAPVALR